MGGSDQAHFEHDASGEESSDPALEGAGVFGSLPRNRPAFRSPRRERPDANPEPAPVDEPAATEPPEATPRAGREAEIEAVARAGAALAAEAATLGLRLAGRAAAALRETVERR